MTGSQESAGRVDMSRLLGRDYWLIRSIPQRGTGPAVIGARAEEHVGWLPGKHQLPGQPVHR
jgi:hypothetical protein